MFTPRQLLVHGCSVEEYRKLIGEVRAAVRDGDRADAVLALLAMLQGKAVNYNSRQAGWDVSRQKTRSTFDLHALPSKKTFAEFEAGQQLYTWCLKQMLDAFQKSVCKGGKAKKFKAQCGQANSFLQRLGT